MFELGKYILNENIKFKQVKKIVKNIPKKEHHYFYNGDSFIDSPYVVYRNIIYEKGSDGREHGGFIDVYTFSDNPEIGIIVIACEPEIRGYGVSDELVKSAKDNMETYDLEKLYWRADYDNIASQKLAVRCGFLLNKQKSTKEQLVYEFKKQDNNTRK